MQTVTIEHVRKAREQMCMARETHLDALAERLKEKRIREVIQPILTGDASPNLSTNHPSMMLAIDLGLIKWDTHQGFTIANPIYEDILTRHLNLGFYEQMPAPEGLRWQKPDGRMDMDALLHEFLNFWQTHSETWAQWTSYTEAFPHLLLMAFMQRLTNGGGRIEREYAAGRGRMDLAVEYHGEWNLVEVKLWRAGRTFAQVKEEGVKQVARYRDTFAPPVGGSTTVAGCYLIIFDRRPAASDLAWSERITWTQEGDITIVGC
jgi:hypothetical protein